MGRWKGQQASLMSGPGLQKASLHGPPQTKNAGDLPLRRFRSRPVECLAFDVGLHRVGTRFEPVADRVKQRAAVNEG